MIPAQQVMQALTILCVLFVTSLSATEVALCPRPCKCFMDNNGIQVANCTDLPDQMTIAWPQRILNIQFGSNRAQPVMLKNKAFKHFPRLTYLDIQGGPIRYVGSLAFDGLTELVELNLMGTNIRKLHHNTFVGNRKLAFLSLRNNPGLSVTPSFLVSKSVTELDLSECSLDALKSVYFNGLPELKYLFAEKNKLRVLGPQFGPPGLKYVNLAHNHIEIVRDDFNAYKRLRTIDLTDNPIICTCELSEIERKLTSKGVAFENTITCKNTGKPLGEMVEMCSDKEMMLGDDPVDIYKEEYLLKPGNSAMAQSMEETGDFGSGSGSGDSELFTVAPARIETKNDTIPEGAVTNNTRVDVVAVAEEILNKTHVSETFVEATSSEIESIIPTAMANVSSEVTVTVVAVPEIDSMTPTATVNVSPETTITTVAIPEIESMTPTELVNVSSAVTITTVPTVTDGDVVVVHVQAADVNSSATISAGKDREIVPQTIQAPEDNEDVQSKVTEYLKSNIGVTGTAAILAIVIVAIVYKAVCSGWSRGHVDMTNNKDVELKDIKYTAANTDDTPQDDSPGESVEENLLLEDRDSDDENDVNNGHETSSRTSSSMSLHTSPVLNGRAAQNGLLHSVMDAVKNNDAAPTAAEVPTRVIVKLCETPKASKPITINNVH